MPINREQDVTDAELAAQDAIPNAPAASDAAISDTNAAVGASRGASNQNITDVANELAGKYGLPANAMQGTAPGIAYGNEDLSRSNEDALALRKVRERQDNVNRTFNFIFGRMVTATGNRQKAADVAMQYALEQDRRAHESAANEKKRQQASKISDIKNQFNEQKIAMTRSAQDSARRKALVNSMISTFAGLAGAAGSAYALRGASTASKAGAGAVETSGNFADSSDFA